MPLYSYYCLACGYKDDELRSMKDNNKSDECPCCGAMTRRRIENSSFRLLGKHWDSKGRT